VKVEFAPSFRKDLKQVRDAALLQRVATVIVKMEDAAVLAEVTQIKAMKGHPFYFRCRVGDYRPGFEWNGERVLLLRFLNRKEIYRRFPPN
jgi:mRNA interferase RelE/StbE